MLILAKIVASRSSKTKRTPQDPIESVLVGLGQWLSMACHGSSGRNGNPDNSGNHGVPRYRNADDELATRQLYRKGLPMKISRMITNTTRLSRWRALFNQVDSAKTLRKIRSRPVFIDIGRIFGDLFITRTDKFGEWVGGAGAVAKTNPRRPIGNYLVVVVLVLANLVAPRLIVASPVPAKYPLAVQQDQGLEDLITLAWAANLPLQSLRARQSAMNEKSSAASYYPDPMIATNFFVKPIETRLGAQKANINLSQQLPWPGKIEAKESEVKFLAGAMMHDIDAMKLGIKQNICTLYYQGYVLHKRMAINRTQKPFLENLAQLALAKVSVGSSGQQDVTKATLEIARLEEDNIKFKRDLISLTTKMNTIINRAFDSPIKFPDQLFLPDIPSEASDLWQKQRQLMAVSHPELLALRAQLDSADSALKFARLERIPDLKVSLSWFMIDEGSAMTKSHKNEDAWAVGAGISLPIWAGKYTAIEQNQVKNREAILSNLQNAQRALENDLNDLLAQISTSKSLIALYEESIIPQSEQILLSNQSAYQQGTVAFDLVVRDFRGYLGTKVMFYQEQAKYLSLLAHIEKTIGQSLDLATPTIKH